MDSNQGAGMTIPYLRRKADEYTKNDLMTYNVLVKFIDWLETENATLPKKHSSKMSLLQQDHFEREILQYIMPVKNGKT